MIIYASREFTKRFKCDLSLKDRATRQPGSLDAWSGHVVRLNRSPLVLMMNDASLYALVFRARGLNSFEALLHATLPRIARVWERHGGQFDPANANVMVLRRTNRSLIGCMTEAQSLLRAIHEDTVQDGREFDPTAAEEELNDTIYSTTDYELPSVRLQRLIRSAG